MLLAAQLDALQVKHVAMITTNHFGDRNADASDIPGHRGISSRATFEEALTDLREIAQRKDIVGMDIAGMEQYLFSKEGKARYIETLDMMAAVGKARGQAMVSRPHVGEGANDVVPGEVYHRDGNRQTTAAGELTHYARARENIEALLESLETVAQRPENGGRLPPQVQVRFGHATHTTPAQAARMAQLGVIVEVNLGSNQATGAVANNKPAPGQADVRIAPNAKGGTFAESVKSMAGLEDHALATLVFNEVDVVLSTDGHDVMNTTLKDEFRRAREVMQLIQSGKRQIRISYEQAVAMNAHEGGHATVAGAHPGAIVEVYYAQLSEKRRALFDTAYRRFFETAQRYVVQQAQHGKGSSGGTR